MPRKLGLALAALAAFAAVIPAATADASTSFTARGSVEQVYVTGLTPGAKVTLLHKGRKLKSDRANPEGGALFRRVKPRGGYRVKVKGVGESEELHVLANRSEPPDPALYDQEIQPDGYQYLETRDGTKLAINVHPPADVTGVLGAELPPEIANLVAQLPAVGTPTPTLIEYSGYGYARPGGPESGISLIGNLLGFTVVDVNMRGTGCSGGAFDFFEPLQNLDGYDVIETIARQDWVAGGKVGMMGISYGGISQLFTAATQPPSLAAITPVSVLDQTMTTLYPGGILNTGFAVPWAEDRIHEAKPAGPESGQEWAWEKIQEGDGVCKANQALHGEAADLQRKIRRNAHYRPRVADPLAPSTFVDKINVPVFMACQWQDEQTGGHCPALASRFTGTDKKWFTFTNGTHIDALAPETFNRWNDFLQLYVAKRAPGPPSLLVKLLAPVVFDEAMGISGLTLPADPVQRRLTYQGALEEFESQPSVRVLFDNGAGRNPAQPYPAFEQYFDELPVPGTIARAWQFSADGRLTERRGSGRPDRFTWDPNARPEVNLTGDSDTGEAGLWTQNPGYDWTQNPSGTALSYVTEPLAEDTAVVGAGAVRAWVRSSKPNVDLQATVTEVRPDGKEVYVQSGWVRGNKRKLARKKSTKLEPVLSLRKRHVKPLPDDRFVKVTIPLYYQGHAYRKGSRIRVIVSAPDGDQPIWAFKTKPRKRAKVSIAHEKDKRSKLILPVVPGVEVPDELPPCPGLRGQPCRDFQPPAG